MVRRGQNNSKENAQNYSSSPGHGKEGQNNFNGMTILCHMGENERNCNKNCGHEGFFEICYIMKLLQKTTLFHLEFKKNNVKIFGVWNHEFWRSIWDINRFAHGPGSCFLKLLQKRHSSILSSKKTVSKFLESEIMSSEEASGISTVLLMDPGLVFWNSFKTVTVPSWVPSKFNTFFLRFQKPCLIDTISFHVYLHSFPKNYSNM